LKKHQAICLTVVAACAASASASGVPAGNGDPLAVRYQPPAQTTPILAAAALFATPKVGLRVGGGPWNEFMINGGVDITFHVPVLPLPALRFDAEVWGKPSDFGKGRRGNAISLLGVQTFLLGYAGIGPTYYFTDDEGNHKSGFGAKLLAGMNLPKGFFLEGGLIVGPNPAPAFVTLGMRF